MIFLDELKPLRIYNSKFLLPIVDKNKYKGSIVFLLTPDYTSSNNFLHHPLLDHRFYESYYIEKEINYIINNENNTIDLNQDIPYNVLNESTETERIVKSVSKYIEDKPFSDKEVTATANTIDSIRKAYNNDEIGIDRSLVTEYFNRYSTPIVYDLHIDFIDFLHDTITDDELLTDVKRIINNSLYLSKELRKQNKIDKQVYSDILDCIKFYLPKVKSKMNESNYEDLLSVVIDDKGLKKYVDYSIIYDIKDNGKVLPDLKSNSLLSLILKYMEKKYNGLKVGKKGNYIVSNSIKDIILKTPINLITINKNKNDHNEKEYKNIVELIKDNNIDIKILSTISTGTKSLNESAIYPIDDVPVKTQTTDEFYKTLKEELKKSNKIDESDSSIGNDFINKNLNESSIIPINNTLEDNKITNTYLESNIDGNKSIIVFNEAMDEDIINESNEKYNTVIRKIIYNERYKNNKEVFEIYNRVKDLTPWILKTFINYKRYKQLNLINDLSFYNQTFFKNNLFKLDKGVDLYIDYISRFIYDKRIDKAGYKQRTVLVPLLDWNDEKYSIYNLNKTMNPISILLRVMRTTPNKLKSTFNNTRFVFYSNSGYFAIDFNEFDKGDIGKFKILVNRLLSKDYTPTLDEIDDAKIDSKKAIVANVVDKIETTQKIKIYSLTGQSEDKDKNELVKKIDKAAAISKNTDDAITNLDKDETNDAFGTEEDFKTILNSIKNQENNTIKFNAVRTARISKLQDQFLNSKFEDKTIKDLLSEKDNDKPLPKTSLNIDSINEDWKNLSFMNFSDSYNINEDIFNIIHSFSDKSVPINIVKYDIEDTSTSEDYIDTYILKCEDGFGKRFTLKFDIPKLINNKFLKLRGNKKTINAQEMLLPIEKTDSDTVQLVAIYNKIFIRRFGNGTGKSTMCADLLLKSLSKYKGKGITITEGDNSKICSKYELPIDYIDIASNISKIESKSYVFYFNQDEFRNKREDTMDFDKGLPIGFDKISNTFIYYNGLGFCASLITSYLVNDEEFSKTFDSVKRGKRYTYSKASILNAKIPLIVVMAFSEGLIKSMDKAHIKYRIQEKREKLNLNTDMIKFKDAYIYYDIDYNSSLLMNGLKECNTEDYSISDINNKSMYLDFLDIFGTRLLSDGLDNFYDLMIDPITLEVLKDYNLPTDYVSLLAYANLLLSDNKYIKHSDMRGKRYRSKEVIPTYLYEVLAKSYGDYRNKLRRSKSGATMIIKQSAIIDAILADPNSADKSELNAILDVEDINAVSPKGQSGMNNARSYSLDKRTFDKSMLGLLGLSTGFAGNVGITRQAVIDMNVTNKRGYLKINENPEDLSLTKAFTVNEALNPFGVTHDDPFRSAMTFIQTTKHGMRTKKSMPMLISNGMDQALPYMTSDTFAFKAKQDGKVIEKTNEYIVIEYKDKTHDFIDLRDNVEKNSDGGFYITLKLDSDYNVGKTFKKGSILAYDKQSFNDSVGFGVNPAYNLGLIAKIAILNTDEGYEDSAIGSTYLSEAMSSEVVDMRPVILDKNTNIYNMVKIGDHIEQGDPLLIFQNSFDDNDVNVLLKNLVDDEKKISDLGRIPIRSEVTGEVQDIIIRRTCDKSELSSSIRKSVNDLEKRSDKLTNVLTKYNVEFKNRYKISTLDTTGKLKNAENSISIDFYIKHHDKLSVGDKIIYYSALKGVLKDVFPKGLEPFSDYRKDEMIHSLLSLGSITARMVCSVKKVGPILKGIIELDRHVKDIAGIKWKYLEDLI